MMEFYPFIVAAHVTSVVFLVGGLLMHERMVSAVATLPAGEQTQSLGILLRLDRQVVTPALLLTWVFGLTLAIWVGWFSSRWLLVKLAVVVALSALHGVQSGQLRRAIRDGSGVKASPGIGIGIVLAMLVIATLAIVKPF